MLRLVGVPALEPRRPRRLWLLVERVERPLELAVLGREVPEPGAESPPQLACAQRDLRSLGGPRALISQRLPTLPAF